MNDFDRDVMRNIAKGLEIPGSRSWLGAPFMIGPFTLFFLGLIIFAGVLNALNWAIHGHNDFEGIDALYSVALLLYLYAAILVHEIGHALAAIHLGYKPDEIRLHILGGWMKLESLGDIRKEKPKEHFFIIFGGIGVTIGMTALTGAMSLFIDNFHTVFEFTALLTMVNLAPIKPLDGGHMFHDLVSMKFGNRIATRATGLASAIFAVAWGIAGSFGLVYFDWLIGLVLLPIAVLIGCIEFFLFDGIERIDKEMKDKERGEADADNQIGETHGNRAHLQPSP